MHVYTTLIHSDNKKKILRNIDYTCSCSKSGNGHARRGLNRVLICVNLMLLSVRCTPRHYFTPALLHTWQWQQLNGCLEISALLGPPPSVNSISYSDTVSASPNVVNPNDISSSANTSRKSPGRSKVSLCCFLLTGELTQKPFPWWS